jgi:hypothetical protein
VGQVTSLFARKVVEEVGGTVDKAALLRSVGLTRGEPADPADRIGDADYYAFLERAAAADPDATTLPLRAGAAMRCDEYGAFGLAWKSAPTLQASYDRAERFWQMLTSVSAYAVEPATNGAFMHLHRNGRRRLGMRLSNEATLASITAISREVATAAFCPVAVYFQHPAPASVAAHEAYFGCPVHFEADRDALLVSADTLQTRVFHVFSTPIWRARSRPFERRTPSSARFATSSRDVLATVLRPSPMSPGTSA